MQSLTWHVSRFFRPFSTAERVPFLMNPPEPAPGQPLLSDTDSKFLEGFFESIEENFPSTSFGEGLNFSDDWLNLPPQFMGHTTSFGQQPPSALESPIHSLAHIHGPFPEMMPPSSSLMPPLLLLRNPTRQLNSSTRLRMCLLPLFFCRMDPCPAQITAAMNHCIWQETALIRPSAHLSDISDTSR